NENVVIMTQQQNYTQNYLMLMEKKEKHINILCGLDLNAHTPDETAISIAAQILAERGGGSARPLALTDGPIHH
ncbi:hypothetical protein ABZW16_28905, partial [Nocardia sp. NPDC004604]